MPLTVTIKNRLIDRLPNGCLRHFGRRLNRQLWGHLVPLALMVLLVGWLTLHAAESIDQSKNSAPPASHSGHR